MAGGFLLVVMLVLALVAGGCSDDENLKPPRASADHTGQRADEAQHTLDQLVGALKARSTGSAEALATPGARDLLASVAANARSLDVRDLSVRYVDDGAPLTSTQRSAFGSSAWIGTVELQYAFGQVDTTPSRVETTVVFAPGGDGARIASFGGADERTPLWLVDRLSVVRQGKTLVAVAGDSAGRYPRLASRAVAQVRRTLPGWHGDLVVEVPRSRAQLEAALLAQAGEYDDIAAVTTTEDGSLASGAPVRVFVNPDVFAKLADRGAQVVMSHESTHVATGATFVNMPTWLLEGFADYVALNHAGVPVSLAAGPDPSPDPQARAAAQAADQRRPRPQGQRARCHLRGGVAGLPLPRPGVRRGQADRLLPRRQRWRPREAGLPARPGHHRGRVRAPVAGRPGGTCPRGRLTG